MLNIPCATFLLLLPEATVFPRVLMIHLNPGEGMWVVRGVRCHWLPWVSRLRSTSGSTWGSLVFCRVLFRNLVSPLTVFGLILSEIM